MRSEIDAVNKRVYDTLNNGVYKAGFAGSQEAYDEAVVPVFETLDWLEEKLSRADYLVGNRLTEADWRLFTTLLRFDPVYHTHFKCNLKRLVDYPALWAYTRRLYQHPAVAPTVNFDHIKGHYFQSHRWINPDRHRAQGSDRGLRRAGQLNAAMRHSRQLSVMVGLGPTIHEFRWATRRWRQANSWMVVPSTTMTIGERKQGSG